MPSKPAEILSHNSQCQLSLFDFFKDAIASPSSYPCQWMSEWLIVSDLEIAIASLSFASLLLTYFSLSHWQWISHHAKCLPNQSPFNLFHRSHSANHHFQCSQLFSLYFSLTSGVLQTSNSFQSFHCQLLLSPSFQYMHLSKQGHLICVIIIGKNVVKQFFRKMPDHIKRMSTQI